jgi:hypothetical protein
MSYGQEGRFVNEENEQAKRRKATRQMLAALVTCSEGHNTVMDNWRWWSPEQVLKHLRDLQSVACEAIAAAEAAGIRE